jgi:trans-2,3-dihydro-3-hydroxyanthranilate isomerase
MTTPPLPFFHVDVFSPRPYGGNSLAVFYDARGLTGAQMLAIAREMRHFESIFLGPSEGAAPGTRRARIFDLEAELDFAGHPALGAACALHRLAGSDAVAAWHLRLNAKTVRVETAPRGAHFAATLEQGRAEFLGAPPPRCRAEIAAAFGLAPAELDPDLPPEVVSTGLAYLVVPVAGPCALARARVTRSDLAVWLAGFGAQYAYLLDAHAPEGRHWQNDGRLEDVATGSGAGCVAAYVRKHGRVASGEAFVLRQGRFVGRPSEMRLRACGAGDDIHSVAVGGDVALVAEGNLVALPEAQ